MNRAFSSIEGAVLDDFTESNTAGRFRRSTKGFDSFGNPRRTIWGYFVTTPGGLVKRPPDGKKCFLSLLEDTRINDRYSVARGLPEIVDLTNKIAARSSEKRRSDAQTAALDESKRPKHGPISGKVVEETYWDSPEAKKLFLGNPNDSRDVVEVLKQRIDRLQQANRSVEGWKDIVENHDKDNLCSTYDVFIIRQRCSILCLAYSLALEEMNSSRWVKDCCATAILTLSRLGMEATGTNEETVAGWNVLLRSNHEHFPMPNPKIFKKKPLPELLEYFPEEITSPWLGYCIEKLADLTVEMARNHLVTDLIPSAAEGNEEQRGLEEEQEEGRTVTTPTIRSLLLQDYLKNPISMTSTWRWLKRLGFIYDTRKKSFFVDGHERQDVVIRRNEFCKRYLTQLEPCAHRWIQVTADTVEEWKREGKISEGMGGYKYISADNTHMVEFHVDDLDFLHKRADDMGFGLFGGNLSVRMPEGVKPLMMFGQDESVFVQFYINSRQWVGPLGQRALLPKTDGMSLMISAMQSRETGFGVEISQMQKDEINESRRGKTYVDVEAAMAIHGQATKKDLKQSPFVVYFELGVNNEGYWTFNHMAIQFEDCVDCLRVLYPHFDFAFFFDHSQGHAKKRANGLDASAMNRAYGGVQQRMRESFIKAEDGYLGMHERTIHVGDNQSFVFKPDDAGPFWMTEQERELNRHDRVLPPPTGGPRKRKKTIAELKAELGPLNVLNDNRRQYRLKELQEMARSKDIDITTNVTQEKKGWQGQPKGLLQVLWERGWIDTGNLDKYTVNPATDADGEVLEGAEQWSLRCLMASCLDFAEELTALEHVGKELGVSVVISPKFHAELAGEGIEYSWGVTKGIYRRKPLDSKRSKEAFKALVTECTSRDALPTATVRKLSRRARAYICAYYSLMENATTTLTLPLIERLVKEYKTHRAALDFDAGFVNGIVRSLENGVNG